MSISDNRDNTLGYQYTFYGNQNNSMMIAGEHINVSNLLYRSNGLLLNGRLTLNCQIQILEDDAKFVELQKEKFQITTQYSETHSDAKQLASGSVKHQVVDSFVYKWTINNFEYFLGDFWDFDEIESKKFQISSSNNKLEFHLCLYPNGTKDKPGNVSIYLQLCSVPQNVDVSARWEISIIDNKGEKKNNRVGQGTFNEKQNAWGFGRYLSVSDLCYRSEELLHQDKLRLRCKIQILENKIARPFNHLISAESLCQSNSQMDLSNDSFRLSKCAHQWAIHNFACVLEKDDDDDDAAYEKELISTRFSSSDSQMLYLKLFPSGFDHESLDSVSIHLNVDLFKRMHFIFQLTLSVVDARGSKLKYFDEQFNFKSSSCVTINKLISHDNILQQKYQLLNNDTLTLCCEILAIENYSQIDLSRAKASEYLRNLSKQNLSKNDITKTVTCARGKRVHFEYNWEIENFVIKKDKEKMHFSKDILSRSNKSYIQSPEFFPPIYSSANKHRFYLKMYPNGLNEECQKYLSMFLGVETIEKRQVTCEFEISLIDGFGFKFNTKKIKNRFNGNDTWGWSEYIFHENLFNTANLLIIDNKVTVHIEIEFIEEEDYAVENQTKFVKTEENREIQNIFNNQLTAQDTSECITQPTTLTHKWTIENFNFYFQTIQERSSYIESSKFSPQSDKKLRFVVRLYPKWDADRMAVYFDLLSNNDRNQRARIAISILDANDRKYFLKNCLIKNWQVFTYLNRKNTPIESNSAHQLKLLFEYHLWSHYSSVSELIPLNSYYAIDDLTEQWSVKALCDVTTHSQTITSLPVATSHHEWSIANFSKQQFRNYLQSPSFISVGSNPVRFVLRMYTNLSQTQDKMSIYLCLEKSEEQNVKMCVQLSILNNDGHIFCAKSGFLKLFDGETELSCIEPFDRNYFTSTRLLPDDILKIICEVNLAGDSSCTSMTIPSRILPDLKPVLTDREPSDVVFEFSDPKYCNIRLHAHREVLIARSRIFELILFKYPTVFHRAHKLCTIDEEMPIFEVMLRFIYTGVAHQVETIAERLLPLSDKYQLDSLKSICENILLRKLEIKSTQNIQQSAKWLLLADKHNAIKLKQRCIQIVNLNAPIIRETSIWGALKENHSVLADLYEDVIQRKYTRPKRSAKLFSVK